MLHYFSKDVTIRLSLEEHRSLKRLLLKMLDQGQYDALYIYAKLKTDQAIDFVGHHTPLCKLEMVHLYNRSDLVFFLWKLSPRVKISMGSKNCGNRNWTFEITIYDVLWSNSSFSLILYEKNVLTFLKTGLNFEFSILKQVCLAQLEPNKILSTFKNYLKLLRFQSKTGEDMTDNRRPEEINSWLHNNYLDLKNRKKH